MALEDRDQIIGLHGLILVARRCILLFCGRADPDRVKPMSEDQMPAGTNV